jgi:anti-anti-sigma regulatory factor
MLKITMIESPAEQVLILEGRLTIPNLAEVERAWETARGSRGTGTRVIDLRNATFIDPRAEGLLLRMKREGARFLACGVANTHQLKRLGIRCREASRKRPSD